MAIVGVAMAMTCLVFSSSATAQRADRKTVMTINQPFQIPGVALPAGTYVMKLVDIAGKRDIVRFMDSNEKKVYATLLAIPDFKLKTPEKGEFSFYEAKPGLPQPLRSWFYPGNNYGLEFVYPKAKAVEIAAATGQPVYATEAEQPQYQAQQEGVNGAEMQPNEKALVEEPVFEVEPGGQQAEIAALRPEAPEVPLMAQNKAPEKLPKTASPFALLGLVGLLAASAATALRVSRKRV